MRLNIPALCFVCWTAAAFAAQPAWELAPPDAKVLVGVDIRGLRNSALSDSITPQMRAQMQAPLAGFKVPAMELLNDIDSVFVAATGDLMAQAPKTAVAKTGAPAATAPTKRTRAPFLLAITGTFPDEHLCPLLKGPHPSYRGIDVYRGTGPEPISIAILDEHTVLIGDDKSIYRAIDRKTTGAVAQGPLIARARELAASNDIWIVARDASGNLQKTAGPAAMFASEIEELDLGLAVRDGFNMDISLATKTEAGARALSQLLLTQMQTAVAAKMDDQRAADFWKKMKMGADGSRVQVQVALTKEELQENIRLMREQRAFRAGSQIAGGPSASTAPGMAAAAGASAQPLVSPQPAAPPKPRVAKIYGLDDGVREVHLDQTK